MSIKTRTKIELSILNKKFADQKFKKQKQLPENRVLENICSNYNKIKISWKKILIPSYKPKKKISKDNLKRWHRKLFQLKMPKKNYKDNKFLLKVNLTNKKHFLSKKLNSQKRHLRNLAAERKKFQLNLKTVKKISLIKVRKPPHSLKNKLKIFQNNLKNSKKQIMNRRLRFLIWRFNQRNKKIKLVMRYL